MDPCTLTETGYSSLLLISLGVVILAMAVFALFSRKHSAFGTLVLTGLLFAMPLFSTSVSAQSTDPCTPGGNISEPGQDDDDGDEDDDDSQTLGLHDDNGYVEFPSVFSHWVYVGVLNNDIPPEGTAYDWESIDLDLDTAGVQQYIDIVSNYEGDNISCANAEIQNGVLVVEVYHECWDEDWFTWGPLPLDFVMPDIQYTVDTLEGDPAPEPASVTIDLSAPVSGVFAVNDHVVQILAYTSINMNVATNDTTTLGSINPSTVDIDLTVPGIQNTLVLDHAGTTFDISVDSNGLLTIITQDGLPTTSRPTIPYVIQNTLGQTSNVGLASVSAFPM